MCKSSYSRANVVDLKICCKMSIDLQNSAWIQPRRIPPKLVFVYITFSHPPGIEIEISCFEVLFNDELDQKLDEARSWLYRRA